jgi:Spy/CpxP family protein refolding chaperone
VTQFKNILIAVLCATLLAAAAISWREYEELIGLRAQLVDADNAALKRQLAEARKTIKSLQDRLAATRGRRGGADGGADGAGAENGPGGPQGRGGRFGMFAALSSNPEFQKLMAIQMKGRLAQTYGPLFKSLNLTPDQLAQFQTLLADKQQAMMDTLQAAREQGINPREDPDGFKALMTQAVAQTDQSIQQVLGDAGFQQYQQYQQTLPERNTVNSLQQQLSYTQTPLTDDEANQMVALLSQNQPQRAGNGTSGTTNGGTPGPGIMALINGGGNAKVTNDAITQASSVLSAPQVSALQAIQAQQQAQQQMQQLMRAANQGTSTAAPAAPAAGAPPGGG